MAGALGLIPSTPEAIKDRFRAGRWQVLLPNVYLTIAGEPSRRQMLVAALLYAGNDAGIDGGGLVRAHVQGPPRNSGPADDARILCVDALISSSAVIHETNGRTAHQRDDLPRSHRPVRPASRRRNHGGC
jgi:hypothetical protein